MPTDHSPLTTNRQLFFRRLVLKDNLALEHESSRGDNLVPVTQAGLDFDTVAARASDLDRSKREFLVIAFLPARYEHIFLGFDLDDRLRRDGE